MSRYEKLKNLNLRSGDSVSITGEFQSYSGFSLSLEPVDLDNVKLLARAYKRGDNVVIIAEMEQPPAAESSNANEETKSRFGNGMLGKIAIITDIYGGEPCQYRSWSLLYFNPASIEVEFLDDDLKIQKIRLIAGQFDRATPEQAQAADLLRNKRDQAIMMRRKEEFFEKCFEEMNKEQVTALMKRLLDISLNKK